MNTRLKYELNGTLLIIHAVLKIQRPKAINFKFLLLLWNCSYLCWKRNAGNLGIWNILVEFSYIS